MKAYKIVILLLLFIAGITSAIVWYQPIKENQIYEKELILNEEEETQVSKWDEDKLIKKAKNTFHTLLGINVEESKYKVAVEVEIVNLDTEDRKKKEVVRVSFFEKKYNAPEYIVAYDTETGELVELYSVYEDSMTGKRMEESDLEKIAREFIFNVTELKKSEIKYSAYVQGNMYLVECTTKNDARIIDVYLNSYTGRVTFYQLT